MPSQTSPRSAALAPAPARTFVPAALDPQTFDQIEPLYLALENRPIHSPAELERWLLDCSELASVLFEAGARRHIAMTCHTDDPAIEREFLRWVEQVQPLCKPHNQKLDEKFLASPFRRDLPQNRYLVFDRSTANDAALFRKENIPLQTEETKLDQQRSKTAGAMTVFFDGQERTMPQMAKYLEEPDRRLRQFAWETSTTRRLANESAFDDLLDGQIALRNQIAKNAGLNSFVDYAFKMWRRFDYTPADCFAFHDAIEKTCMPLVKKLHQRRMKQMNLPALRPWDTSVDPLNRPPLRPFSTADELAELTHRILHRVDPDLAGEFQSLRTDKLLDLDSRPGKAPGGYQTTLDERRVPFIFMNAAGLHGDIMILLHEAGHAFHTNAARTEDLVAYRSAPIEFCEVASMGMELLGLPELAEIYPPAEHARARRMHLEGIIGLFPWIAQIDAFQHWLYTHPAHSHQQRNEFWLSLQHRFAGLIDWSGYEKPRATYWQRQGHLWSCPFYYVEYGIAQLGALQLWAKSLSDRPAAIAAYKRALALGGSRPLPELFAAAGLRFDFSAETLAPLMDLIGEELAKLPE